MHVFVSGRPSLDLLGTLKWRRDVDPEEMLTIPRDVEAWFAQSALALNLSATATDLERVHGVREALYRVVTAVRSHARPRRGDVALLNEMAACPLPALHLTGSGAVRCSATVQQGLTVVVRDAFDLLADGTQRVRGCANPRCTRLFLDTSRGGTRRWCGMAECGNNAKVAAFRARQRG